MNLIFGEIADRKESLAALENIGRSAAKTLSRGALPLEKVLAACAELSSRLKEEEHLPALLAMGVPERRAREELRQAKAMLKREYLQARLIAEFGEIPGGAKELVPFGAEDRVVQTWKPLGVLLHIAAGNADALPAWSAIEGLLTGNINILKLPGGDDGLSIPLLLELIRIEPLLAEYLCVFDCPSEDMRSIEKMASAADAVVVWGSDDAVAAVRRLAKPDTRIIEWGHKIGFAYVSDEEGVSDRALEGLACSIAETEQLLCSSCQGIFLDTADQERVLRFAERFLPLLDAAARGRELPLFTKACKTLELYTERLESVCSLKRVYQTAHCGVIAAPDCRLEPSHQFCNPWVKPLPSGRLLDELHAYKNHLQTAALLCPDARRAELTDLLVAAGVVRVTGGRNMTRQYCGMPHDGEFSLRRYMKRVSVEFGGE